MSKNVVTLKSGSESLKVIEGGISFNRSCSLWFPITRWSKKFQDRFSRLDTIPAFDGRTEIAVSQQAETALYAARRAGKNYSAVIKLQLRFEKYIQHLAKQLYSCMPKQQLPNAPFSVCDKPRAPRVTPRIGYRKVNFVRPGQNFCGSNNRQILPTLSSLNQAFSIFSGG